MTDAGIVPDKEPAARELLDEVFEAGFPPSFDRGPNPIRLDPLASFGLAQDQRHGIRQMFDQPEPVLTRPVLAR
jgi:hypothetical protein